MEDDEEFDKGIAGVDSIEEDGGTSSSTFFLLINTHPFFNFTPLVLVDDDNEGSGVGGKRSVNMTREGRGNGETVDDEGDGEGRAVAVDDVDDETLASSCAELEGCGGADDDDDDNFEVDSVVPAFFFPFFTSRPVLLLFVGLTTLLMLPLL